MTGANRHQMYWELCEGEELWVALVAPIDDAEVDTRLATRVTAELAKRRPPGKPSARVSRRPRLRSVGHRRRAVT